MRARTPKPSTPRPAPRPTSAPRPAPTTPAPAPANDDLVARIIAQLTPFIGDTVNDILAGSRSAPVATPAPVPVAVSTFDARADSLGDSSSVQGIFGVAGENNVRVNTPDFNFAYDLRK